MISLNYRDKRPIFEQIRQNFVRLIASGVLEPDEKLPSVRELASQLAINPNTIQKAYTALESEGYIYTVSGKGCFVHPGEHKSERRVKQLMDELRPIVQELAELSVDKNEIKKLIDSLYAGKEQKGESHDKG